MTTTRHAPVRPLALTVAAAGALLLALPGTAGAAAPASSWFQGGQNQSRTGYNATETTLPPAQVRHLHQVWSARTQDPGTEAPEATSAVSTGGIAYTLGAAGDLHAIRVSSGATVWTASASECGDASVSPALHEGVLVVATQECTPDDAQGHLAGYNAVTGARLWDLVSDMTMGEPLTFGGRVYAESPTNRDFGRRTILRALDVHTGRLEWTKQLGSTRPAMASDGQHLLLSRRTSLTALDPATGAQRWTRSAPGGLVLASAGHIITVGPAGSVTQVTAFSSAGARQWSVTDFVSVPSWISATNNEVLLATRGGELDALSLGDGSDRWSTVFQTEITSQPAVADGVVYVSVVSPRGQSLRAVADGSGRDLWHYEDTHSVGSAPVGAPSVAAGTVFASLGSPYLRAFRP